MKGEIKPAYAAVAIIAALAAIGFVFFKATTVGSIPPLGKGNPGPFSPGGAAVAAYKPPPTAKKTGGGPPGANPMQPAPAPAPSTPDKQ